MMRTRRVIETIIGYALIVLVGARLLWVRTVSPIAPRA